MIDHLHKNAPIGYPFTDFEAEKKALAEQARQERSAGVIGAIEAPSHATMPLYCYLNNSSAAGNHPQPLPRSAFTERAARAIEGTGYKFPVASL